MKQRQFIARLNRERLSIIHDLIDRLVPIDPLTPEAVADLKKAAIACGVALSGTTVDIIRKMMAETADRADFLDVPAGEAKAGRRKVKKLVYPGSGRRG